MTAKHIFASILLCCVVSINAIAEELSYFGQEPPGLKVTRFAPGIISLDNRYEQSLIFSPDGQECYFSVSTAN